MKVQQSKQQSKTWDATKHFQKGCLKQYHVTSRKISNKDFTLHLKQLEKEEQTKPKVSRRKQIIKIREEINEMETVNNCKDQ